MNKAAVVFLTRVKLVSILIKSGICVKGSAVQVTPLSVPANRVLISNVPLFIKDKTTTEELARFGKLVIP